MSQRDIRRGTADADRGRTRGARERHDEERGGTPAGAHARAEALILLDETRGNLPAVHGLDATPPVIVPGTGVPMGNPFVARRERPLTMRLAMLTLAACIVVTGLFTVTPLGGSNSGGLSTFQALSGALVLQRDVTFHWYVAQPGDEIEKVANKFGVEIGGIYELNNIPAGQDLMIGKPYKIPDDPFYGKNFVPASPYPKGNGSTTFGSNWFTSATGDPLPGAPCAPYDGTPAGFRFVSPDPGAVWIRGFMGAGGWIHNGIDLAAPEGHPVVAAQAGQVLFAGWAGVDHFGYAIKINHCHGVATLYGHLATMPLVKAGDWVQPGEPIGLEGMTGWAQGPHLHFSVFVDDQFVDPLPYFNNDISATTRDCHCYNGAG